MATYTVMGLPFPSAAEARLSAADDTIVQEGSFADPPPRASNPAYGEEAGTPAKKGKGRAFKVSPEALSLYDGYDGLLVRTALIRPPGYGKDTDLQISDARSVERLLRHLKYSDQEHMVVIGLSNQNFVNAIYEVSIGTSTGTAFQARDAVKIIILSASVGAIIAHNHPSGNPTPSQDDLKATKVLQGALSCMGYKFLDHVIVAANGITSFYEQGLL